MSDQIQCTLSENALDYLLLAGEQVQTGEQRMLKHAIATLADGIELLLKARLEFYDWSLLFKDVDKVEKTKFECGDFQSVTVDQAIKRLKNICGVSFDHHSFPMLTQLRKLRNRIRHFAVSVESAQAQSMIANAYSFAIDFIAEELKPNSKDDLEFEVSDLRKLLGEFSGFVDQRMKDIKETLESQKYASHIQCPACLQETLYPEGDNVVCAFCNFRTDGESAAHLWADENMPQSLSDSLIAPVVRPCPECGSKACIPAGEESATSYSHVCLKCAESGDYTDCSRCGGLCSVDSAGYMCGDCRDSIMSKWD